LEALQVKKLPAPPKKTHTSTSHPVNAPIQVAATNGTPQIAGRHKRVLLLNLLPGAILWLPAPKALPPLARLAEAPPPPLILTAAREAGAAATSKMASSSEAAGPQRGRDRGSFRYCPITIFL